LIKKTLTVVLLGGLALSGLTACDNTSGKGCSITRQAFIVPDSVAEKGGGGGGGGGHSSGGSSSGGHSTAGEGSAGSATHEGTSTSGESSTSTGAKGPSWFPFFGGGASGSKC